MLNHIVMIKFKDGMNEADRRIAAYNIKKELERLNGKIAGLVSLKVEHYLLPGSDVDIMIQERFEDEAAMKTYIEAPLHLTVKKYIKENTLTSTAADFYD